MSIRCLGKKNPSEESIEFSENSLLNDALYSSLTASLNIDFKHNLIRPGKRKLTSVKENVQITAKPGFT